MTNNTSNPVQPGNAPATSSTNSPDTTGYLVELASHEQRMAQLRPANKAALFDILQASGISQILVSFDGYGDSGQLSVPRGM